MVAGLCGLSVAALGATIIIHRVTSPLSHVGPNVFLTISEEQLAQPVYVPLSNATQGTALLRAKLNQAGHRSFTEFTMGNDSMVVVYKPG